MDSQSVKSSIHQRFTEHLDYLRVPYFLGGSVRFGYQSGASDLDIFAYFPNDEDLGVLLQTFPSKFLGTDKDYPGSFRGFEVLGGLIHLNITDDCDVYSGLKKEHEDLASLIDLKISFRNLAKRLRNPGCYKGSEIYKILNLALPSRE